MMRGFASSLFRCLTVAAGGSTRVHFRLDEAEFPAASQSACKLLERTWPGSRAADCASIDALRPFNNWVKPEDQYGISFIGEKRPAFARRLPQKGRQSPAPPERAIEGAGEEIVLAENHGVFHRWKTGTSDQTNGADGARQRFRAFAFAAQT